MYRKISLIHSQDIIFDRRHIWHPYTSMTKPLPSYPVVSAVACELILSNGQHLVDGMSSWWSAIHGYNHPRINQAMNDQINRMSHVMFGGITHRPAIELCRSLVTLTPSELECVFLADSGSVAIEIAIKMALQYWQARGDPRYQLLALRYGYHGDTLGAMSVCDPDNSLHSLYSCYLPQHYFIDTSIRRFGDTWCEGDDIQIIKTIDTHYKTLAAVILEPIVQSAGGMRFYHPDYLRRIRELCDRYKLLLIADEIATGFGRTGELWACDHAGIAPDIICIGKALTGGTMTLSATITSRKIAETISNGSTGCLMHGPTFMGNPLACAAANASISLLAENSWRKRVTAISDQLSTGLLPLINHSKVVDVRVLGAIGVVETKYSLNIAVLQRWFVDYGVWIRPFGKLIYLMPPYIIEQQALQLLIDAIVNALDQPLNFIFKS